MVPGLLQLLTLSQTCNKLKYYERPPSQLRRAPMAGSCRGTRAYSDLEEKSAARGATGRLHPALHRAQGRARALGALAHRNDAGDLDALRARSVRALPARRVFIGAGVCGPAL